MIEHAVLLKVTLTQLNDGAELKENDIIAMISNLVKENARQIISSPRNLWRKIKAANAVVRELSKEQQVELWRQMWTTVHNLELWYDSWESFYIEYGFGIDDGTGHVKYTEEQRRRIANMDETKFSMDRADGGIGGIGGRPTNSITIANITRSGTGYNKASMSSTLMCGTNAAGEPPPVHVMFSSNAQEENFVVDCHWVAVMPKIQGIFEHESINECCAQVIVNEKGGSDRRVLSQCLTDYQERLYPDADDVPGKRILCKINGGPGRLDEKALSEARTRSVYLFPGVQNTTAVTQETD
jgi:hypothetical protein